LEHKAIRIYTLGEKKMVHSFEFYKAMELRRCNYTRWMVENVLNIGEPGNDYSPIPDNTVGRTIRFRLRYFLDVDFAIGLCLGVKRREASLVRRFLMESKGIKIDLKNDLRPDLKGSNIPLRNFNKPKNK
jgi:hypothetical protein